MRTRLDEIRDEELRGTLLPVNLRPGYRISAAADDVLARIDRALQRAFRHGVEMDRAHSWIGEPVSAVQPAPAGEKKQRFFRAVKRVGGVPVGPGVVCVDDERKGERRKVDPVVLTENFPGVKLFTRRDGYVRIDRRTGTNRRSRG